MSEYASKKTRGPFIAAVFAMQGFGILGGGILTILISSTIDVRFPAPTYAVDPIASTIPQADYVWRIILMVGSLLAFLTHYWRMKMPETARYTALVAKNAEQAASDMSKVLQVDLEAEVEKVEQIAQKPTSSFGLFSKQFLRRHGLHLLGTTSTWFLLDIAFYSQNLFQKDIFTVIGWIPPAKTMNAVQEVFKIARAQTLIAMCSTIPGYWKVGGYSGCIWVLVFGTKPRQGKGRCRVSGVKNSLIVLGLLFTFLMPESKGKLLAMSGENEDLGGDELEQPSYNNRTVPVV
ncbi:hypothetical protein RHSIM_Rhsim06G0150000 [Rhododendron simsii]|uniref:Uncharacterized protein n=1 Tax=Rhododendron simsii TaxID=118357 RepID=A0A834GSR9_RHOSS|nr:hypothetical protein RHSIM_Rhsim06G0150000 [Rhododendron simsii]